MFQNFPDVVNVTDLQKMLGIGKSSAYLLLQNNHIPHVKVGRKYIIPKQAVIDFLNKKCYNVRASIVG